MMNLNDLVGYAVEACDGGMGKIQNFLFDDSTKHIRYVVVETGGWFHSRRVLISPVALGCADSSRKAILVSLTREQVRTSPDVDTAKPVSRQYEIAINQYYGWPHYWTREPIFLAPEVPEAILESLIVEEQEGDLNLRSTNEVRTYAVDDDYGEIGFVSDFLVDEKEWMIREIVVTTGSWSHFNNVTLPAKSIKAISCASKRITLFSSSEKLQSYPSCDSPRPADHEREPDAHALSTQTGNLAAAKGGR